MASSMSKYDTFRNPGKKKPEVANVGTKVQPTPKKVGPASVGGAEKFEAIPFDQVAGGPGNANAGHGGHGKNTGAISAAAQKESRGIVEQAGMFVAAKGNSPKRSAGTKTPTDRATREKLATAEGG
jgi:hypothetical protein